MQNLIQIEMSYYRIQKKFGLSRGALRACRGFEINENEEIQDFLNLIDNCFYLNVSGEFYEDVKLQRNRIIIIIYSANCTSNFVVYIT
jgi:hypothetical protein